MNRILLLSVVLTFSAVVQAKAPSKVLTCVGCHGPNGISANSLWPNLAGQKAQYLMKQLRDFQEGKRFDVLMSPVAKSLSSNDIKILAEYYSSLSLGGDNAAPQGTGRPAHKVLW